MQRRRSTRTGRVKTLGWREDPEIQARLRRVERVYSQPIQTGLDIVNRQLTADGKDAISVDQYFTDRQHIRELFAELSAGTLEEHVTRNLARQAQIERDLMQLPPAQRAPLHAVLIRLEEDLMKVTGVWGGQREVAGIQVDEASMGPSAQELLEAGEIDRPAYQQYIAILARTTGGQNVDPRRMAALAAQAMRTIDGEAEEVDAPRQPAGAPGPAIRRGAYSDRPALPPPGMPAAGAEPPFPHVVTWEPDEEDGEC